MEDILVDFWEWDILFFKKVLKSLNVKHLSFISSNFGKYSLEGDFIKFLHCDSTGRYNEWGNQVIKLSFI